MHIMVVLICFQDIIIQIFHSARHLIHLNLLHIFRNIYQQWIQPKLLGTILKHEPKLERRLNIKVVVMNMPICSGWDSRKSPRFRSEGSGFGFSSPFDNCVTMTLRKCLTLMSLTSLNVELLGLLNPCLLSITYGG